MRRNAPTFVIRRSSGSSFPSAPRSKDIVLNLYRLNIFPRNPARLWDITAGEPMETLTTAHMSANAGDIRIISRAEPAASRSLFMQSL